MMRRLRRELTREGTFRYVPLAVRPTKRFAEIEEVGALAVSLAGDLRKSITRAALPIDGGWIAH